MTSGSASGKRAPSASSIPGLGSVIAEEARQGSIKPSSTLFLLLLLPHHLLEQIVVGVAPGLARRGRARRGARAARGLFAHHLLQQIVVLVLGLVAPALGR